MICSHVRGLATLSFAVLAAALPSQNTPLAEAGALQQKWLGHFASANAAFLDLLDQTVAQATGGAEAAALAEYCARRAIALQPLAGAADPTARLRAAAAQPLARAQPLLADRLLAMALQQTLEDGAPGSGELALRLGCIQSWWLLGPFDNERGAGHARAYGPEQTFDLHASYDGKRHAAVWRPLTVPAPGGRIELDELLRPNEQVCAYAAIAVIADRAIEAALCLGSSCSWRACGNGVEIGAREVQRRCAFDQDAVRLPLQPGANLLLLKLCHQEGGEFAFVARLRALDGSVLAGVRTSTAAADLTAAAKNTAPPAATAAAAALELGARTHWLPRADAGDPVAAQRVAFLLQADSTDGDFERRDLALLQRAVAGRPDDVEARLLLARARVRQSANDAERDDNLRRADYETILAAHPDFAEAAVELGRLDLDGPRIATRAEELARTALRSAPDCGPARLLLADALSHQDQPALARDQLRAADDQPPTPPALGERLADALHDVDDPTAELSVRKQLAAATAAPATQVAYAEALLHAGQASAATTVLRTAITRTPFARRPRAVLAELLAAQGELAAALRTWSEWLELCPDDDDALVAQSHLHGCAGDLDRQLETLRTALELNPNRRDDRRWFEFLAAAQTPFYQAWRQDGAPLYTVAPPADAAAARDAVHWLLQQRVVAAYKNGTTSEYRHDVVRILTEEGARRWSRYRLPFFDGEQRARLLACSVKKADGALQRPSLRGALVALPALQPGDVVDVEGRIDDLAPTFFGDYFGISHVLSGSDGSPVHRSELTVLAAAGRDYFVQSANGAPEPELTAAADGGTVYRWTMLELPRDVPEPRRPEAREREPLVRMTTFRDWDQFAGWWWNLIRRELEVTPVMRQKLAELTAGATTTADKIAAVYHFVTTDVRYEAWEFGVHGYKPYSTAVIYERRHGDCKDKALLLCALLGELSVTAAPVLIFADDPHGQDDLSVPLVQHFNHCIAWMPPQDGRPGAFLDGTATWHGTRTTPAMDQGARVLVVDHGHAELRQVPWTTPQANAAFDQYTIELHAAGDAAVTLRRQPCGNRAVDLRAMLGTEPARRQEQFERHLGPVFGKVEQLLLEASDPLAVETPLELTVRCRVPEFGARQGDELLLKSSFAEDDLQALTSEPERRTALLLGPPSSAHDVVRYQLPASLQIAELPAPVTARTAFGEFTMQWRRDGDAVLVERTLVLARERVPPAEYPAFRDFVATVRSADGRLLVCKRREHGR